MVVVVKASGCVAKVVTGAAEREVMEGRLVPMAFFSIVPFVMDLSPSPGLTTALLLACANVDVTVAGELDITSLNGELPADTVAVVTFFRAVTSFGIRSILTTGLVFAFRNGRADELTLQPAFALVDEPTALPSIRTELGTCFKLALVGGGLFTVDDLAKLVTGKDNVFASSEFSTLDVAACSSKVAVTDATGPWRISAKKTRPNIFFLMHVGLL